MATILIIQLVKYSRKQRTTAEQDNRNCGEVHCAYGKHCGSLHTSEMLTSQIKEKNHVCLSRKSVVRWP